MSIKIFYVKFDILILFEKHYKRSIMRVRYSTTLNDDLLEKLKIRAIKEKRRINELLEQAIKDYLKKTLNPPLKASK